MNQFSTTVPLNSITVGTVLHIKNVVFGLYFSHNFGLKIVRNITDRNG
jgi:hypothetical protein